MAEGAASEISHIEGVVRADEIERVYELLFLIPPNLGDTARYRIAAKLIELIASTPGDEAVSLLLRALTTDGLLPDDLWNEVADILAEKRYYEAIPVLEQYAFGEDRRRIPHAGAALIAFDRDRYLPRVIANIEQPREHDAVYPYIETLRMAAWHTCLVDIAPALPAVQRLFETTTDPHTRIAVVNTLFIYCTNFRSNSVKNWLLNIYRRVLDSSAPEYTDFEREWYSSWLEGLDQS